MRFGVLGALVVWDDEGETVRVPELKVRALLADLLTHDGKPVSADRLVQDLWGDEPPGKPTGALQAKVSQLRRVLGRDRVVLQAPGYRLRLDPAADEVDAGRFHALVAEARPVRDPHTRAVLLTEALDLWRGPAYADFADEEFVRGAVRRLTEQRLSVLEEQAEARLEAGDHVMLAGELADLVASHPLRERLRALQMRALYLTGRQSEALASYESLRSRLADDLGVDPGPALSALHQAVLRQDPGLGQTFGMAPGTGMRAPDTGMQAPGAAAVAPGAGATSPGEAVVDRGGAVRVSGTAMTAPSAGATSPGEAVVDRGGAARVSDTAATAPGAPVPALGTGEAAAVPGGAARASGRATTAPGVGAISPGKAAVDRGGAAGLSGTATTALGTGAISPGEAVVDPGGAARVSDTATSAPGAPAPALVTDEAAAAPGSPAELSDTATTAPSAPTPAPRTTATPPALTPPAPNPLAGPPHSNLPVPLTPLIGRAEALTGLSQLLTTARLVTLTGPGGVGKTRLAGAAAGTARADELPDGVWLVEFSGVRGGTAADLAQVVASALGIRDDAPSALPGAGAGVPSPSPAHRLAAVLRDRRTLLVLDNCEHVVDAAAELAELLLRTAPGLRVLVTSQEPLGLAGEAVFLVEPLGTDDAVRLFTERAAASAPGFSLDPDAADPDDRAAVAEICRRLDGIPLALELAATRVRALGVRELAARLGDRFRILTAGQRGAPARQQTLRAMIDWSWELLSAPERIVLRRLAVHSDGCDLAAAEAVCAGDGVAREEVLDLVTRLVDRSFVVVVQGPTGPRYRLLESVAAYAMERLHEMQDLTAVRDRHLRHYLALAERAESRLRCAGQRSWLARLDADAGNLRAALDEAVRCAPDGQPEEAVRLATALSWWWLLRGRLTEARRSLSTVLAAAPDAAAPELTLVHAAFALLTGDPTEATATAAADAVPDPVRRARALWLCAYGLFSAGEATASAELNARALDLFDAADEQWGTAAALGLRATLALVRGDLGALGRDGLRSAELFGELGDRWGELQTVSPLAALAEIKGEYEEAARLQREGLRMARELGLEAEVSARLSGLGRLALLARDWDQGRALHEQARRSAAEQGYRYGEIHAEMGLALGARRSGDLDAAQAHLLHIRDGHADVSSEAGDHLLLAELGFIAEVRGDAGQSVRHHLHGLDVARSLGEPRALALSLEGLAGAASLGGPGMPAECAALLLGAADAARRGVGAPLPPAERGDVDRVAAAARAALGGPAFTEAFECGARLTAEEAVRHARTALDWPENAAG
ncbi:BTAD domain-containing putative transcriptional regulator [Streptomyces sp. NBC_00620]|uniref:BTAD domain-containing putative transcriptional regulator n=1 Tax=Streptomyces sp. NBC_00620 TaxID=2903666 RepID=UPI00225A7031|nr:BTAD domain-containing putative transcriptional regulator [Streptomyces sp. NBC_00620]MCX4978180.1 winged helix-turn-helix domain-containing protein [Streptomyces sp. NBC_00620]